MPNLIAFFALPTLFFSGVRNLANIVTRLGALVAIGTVQNTTSSILDSLAIHENILSSPITGNIELSHSEILNLQIDDTAKLKGFALSANTIRNSVPAFSLQIYSNPCLYWLATPAFTLLAAKTLRTSAAVITPGLCLFCAVSDVLSHSNLFFHRNIVQ